VEDEFANSAEPPVVGLVVRQARLEANVLGPAPEGEPEEVSSERWLVDRWHQFDRVGVYTCFPSDAEDLVVMGTVVVLEGSNDVRVRVTDTGCEPAQLRIRPLDRVWWLWQDCRRRHSISQISEADGTPLVRLGQADNHTTSSGGGSTLAATSGGYCTQFRRSGLQFFASPGHALRAGDGDSGGDEDVGGSDSACTTVVVLSQAHTQIIDLSDEARWCDDGNSAVLAR
jgi:hypothetical protein